MIIAKKFKYIIAFVILLICISKINSNLIGIDLGTEYIKIAMLKAGRPFTMVENIQSKTKTPLSVAFKDDERVFGADAIAKKPKLPKQVLTYLHKYLAKRRDSAEVNSILDKFFISYDLQDDTESDTIKVRIDFNKEEWKFTIEELFGMIFRYVKFLTDKFSNGDIRDCVITIPNFYGYKEKQVLAQAVQLSKLNLVGLVSENVAAAVQFSINKSFETTEHYIFYNIGSSHTQATLVSYTSTMKTVGNKTQEAYKSLNVMGESWEKDVGGNSFDYNIVRLLMDKFDNLPERNGKRKVSNDYKIAERMLPFANKYKEILSANKEAIVKILGLDGGNNLEGKITREEFEAANKNEFDRVFDPLETLLRRTGLGWNNITNIELLGGSTRVPKVQEVLKEKLGEYSNLIGTHMNGDDSMAFGAAFLCANSSSHFQGGKKVHLKHGSNYDLRLNLKEYTENNDLKLCEENYINNFNTTIAVDCLRPLHKNATIFKLREKPDVTKTLSLKHDGDFQVDLLEKFEDSDDERLLATYYVTGVHKILSELTENFVKQPPKVNLKFKQDKLGLVSLTADLTYNVTLWMKMSTGPTGAVEFIYTNEEAFPIPEEELKAMEDELNAKEGVTEGERTILKMKKDIGKRRDQIEKRDLTIRVVEHSPKPFTKDQIEASKAILDKLDRIDLDRIKTMEKRNALETMIYAKKEFINSDLVKDYSKDNEIEVASEKLNVIYEWYDEEGYTADYDKLKQKFDELSEIFKTYELRMDRVKRREKASEDFLAEIDKYSNDAIKLIKTKPWVEAHYNNTFTKELESVNNWFAETKGKQSLLALHDDPVLTAENIGFKINSIKREYYSMAGIPKPKDVKDAEDKMKNPNLEEMMRKANITQEQMDELIKKMNENKKETGESNTEEPVVDDEKESKEENKKEDANAETQENKDDL